MSLLAMPLDELRHLIVVSGRILDEKLNDMARLMSELDEASVVGGPEIADLVLLDKETDALLDIHEQMIGLHALKTSLTFV
jgi:hypothetical protein